MLSAHRDIPPRSVLVIKPSSFGDVVHTLPAVAKLKTAWPDTHLTWVINPEWAPLLSENSSVDEVLLFPRRQFRAWMGVAKFLRWCRATMSPRQPDLAIDFQGLLRSAWIGRVSRPSNFVGMADAREGARWFYNHLAPSNNGLQHAVTRYVAAADHVIGLFPHPSPLANPAELLWPLPTGEPVSLGDASTEDFVLLHPYARGQGKSLTTEEIRRICQELSPRRIILVGQHQDSVPPAWPVNCLNLLNQTSLEQLIWLIRRAAFVITVDSGPAHLAAALRRPMVAIHTWSDPQLVGPFWNQAWVWKDGRLLQVKELSNNVTDLLEARPLKLKAEDIRAICALATSF